MVLFLLKGGNMDGFQMLIFILGILFGAFTFFLPAVIVKKLIIDRVTITLNVKIITMFFLGTATLLFADILAYTINGGIPSTNKWALWMLIDYYYLFHFKMKKKDNKSEVLKQIRMSKVLNRLIHRERGKRK